MRHMVNDNCLNEIFGLKVSQFKNFIVLSKKEKGIISRKDNPMYTPVEMVVTNILMKTGRL